MKHLSTIILITFAWTIEAATWPDTVAPCNTTLQACVDGVPQYETITINTNTEIDETITAFKAVSLVAGSGYHPTFAAGRHIELTHVASSNRTTRIEGLTMHRGRIAYNHQSGSSAGGTLVIKNNRVLDNSSEFESIRILNFSDQTLTINVDYNEVNYIRTTGTTAERGAIMVKTGLNPTAANIGATVGRIYGNTLYVQGPDSVGIGLFTYADTELSLDVAGNVTKGGRTAALFAHTEGASVFADLDIGNNAYYANDTSELFRGVYLQTFGGTTNADIVNNTALGAFDAFNFDEASPGVLDVYLYNNLMAFGSAAVFTDNQTTITNDHNLSYMNPFVEPNFVPGPNHLTVNPEVVSRHDGRLRPNSPAIESGYGLALLALGSTPFVDADGTSRIKKGDDSVGTQLVDIGAYETGDLFFNHVTDTTSHISTINNNAFNGNNTLDDIHITANWNPPGGAGVYNNDNEAIYYNGGFWRIFNEGITGFEPNATFNVHQYGNTSNTIEHTATEGSIGTVIDHSSLNNQSDRIVQITQNWTGIYNPHPVGVMYLSGAWLIANLDSQNIPVNSHFNVYSQPPSKSAWKHVATANNSFGQITYLDHPLINGVECAELQVTQSAEQGVFNNAPIGVYFEFGRWAIFNQDLSDMLPNSAFHIMANPAQIAACTDLIFADDFE